MQCKMKQNKIKHCDVMQYDMIRYNMKLNSTNDDISQIPTQVIYPLTSEISAFENQLLFKQRRFILFIFIKESSFLKSNDCYHIIAVKNSFDEF